MFDALERLLMRVLRVPAEPSIPAGEGAVRVFRAAPNYYRYTLVRWVLVQAGAALGLLVGYIALRYWVPPVVPRVVYWFEAFAIVSFIVQIPVTYAMLRLDYELRWYILGERSLRIRHGLTRMREQTMTFANVQNLSVRQGPLQRMLGIADLEVRTAGGGGGGTEEDGAAARHGRLQGVAEPAVLRDLIRIRVRAFRDAGLGDPDDHAPPRPGPTSGATGRRANSATLDAARQCLIEVRSLRSAIRAGR
jgi:membrane protein YdbS with pleckstrin-like domain